MDRRHFVGVAAAAGILATAGRRARGQNAGSVRVLVFDVNETLLDLRALEPQFQTVFGDGAVYSQWFCAGAAKRSAHRRGRPLCQLLPGRARRARNDRRAAQGGPQRRRSIADSRHRAQTAAPSGRAAGVRAAERSRISDGDADELDAGRGGGTIDERGPQDVSGAGHECRRRAKLEARGESLRIRGGAARRSARRVTARRRAFLGCRGRDARGLQGGLRRETGHGAGSALSGARHRGPGSSVGGEADCRSATAERIGTSGITRTASDQVPQ